MSLLLISAVCLKCALINGVADNSAIRNDDMHRCTSNDALLQGMNVMPSVCRLREPKFE